FSVFPWLEVVDFGRSLRFLFLHLVWHVTFQLFVVLLGSGTKKPHRGINPRYGSLFLLVCQVLGLPGLVTRPLTLWPLTP
ncbi:MAG TPA: hypothetical protein VE843_09980, partial [Ktedonobacteraceae bacterium]|nr:hypothetical protein [Ktedonobacteraceae bacterium]